MAEDDKKDPPATGDEGKGGKDAILADLAKERDKRQALEKQVKDLEPLAAAAKKAEEDKLDEVGKLQKQLSDAEKARDAATADATRYKVALDKGLTLAQSRRLSGATEAELAADADAYRKEHGLDKAGDDGKKPPAGGKPTEDLRGGGDPDDSPPVDVSKVVDSIPRGF